MTDTCPSKFRREERRRSGRKESRKFWLLSIDWTPGYASRGPASPLCHDPDEPIPPRATYTRSTIHLRLTGGPEIYCRALVFKDPAYGARLPLEGIDPITSLLFIS
uniref:Uncharacterized protein n=1 Tax=Oryza punctata TaxID=4537 RepID=A0A0E0JRR1_ORYPU